MREYLSSLFFRDFNENKHSRRLLSSVSLIEEEVRNERNSLITRNNIPVLSGVLVPRLPNPSHATGQQHSRGFLTVDRSLQCGDKVPKLHSEGLPEGEVIWLC